MVWPSTQPNTVVFGCLDGKVRAGSLKSNKSQTLYAVPAPAIACVARSDFIPSVCIVDVVCHGSPDGACIATGHTDGTIMTFRFDDADGAGAAAVAQS